MILIVFKKYINCDMACLLYYCNIWNIYFWYLYFFINFIRISKMRASEESNDIQLKQAYVYEHIFEQEYDVQAFAQFLAAQPPRYSSNLQELSYDQVKNAVDNFVKVNKKSDPKQITQVYEGEKKDPTSVSQTQMSQLNTDYNTTQYYLKSRQCVKEINKFALTSIAVNIISFKKNQGGLLSRAFVTFKIQLPQLHKIIDRRYSDFQWLRSALQYHHPGVVLPPLPKKKMKKIFTEDHLKKKGRMLQNFLRKSLEMPDIRNDQNTYKFLTIEEQQKFEQYKKQNKILKGTVPIQKIKSSTGIIQYGIQAQMLAVNKKGIQYFKTLSPLMKQLYKAIKRVEQNFGVCAQHLNNLQNLSKRIMPIQEQFRRDCGKNQYSQSDQRQKSVFQNVSIFAQHYKEQLKEMRQNWQKEIYMKMKYQFHHSEAFNQHVVLYQSIEKDFYNMKESLNKKKAKMYSRPIAEWQVSEDKKSKFAAQKPSFAEAAHYMMPKKSQQLSFLQFNYALQTKQISNSISHYAKFNNVYSQKNFEKFLQKEYELTHSWDQKLKSLITQRFELSLGQSKEKVKILGNSIKGFFSQYSGKNNQKIGQDKGFRSTMPNHNENKNEGKQDDGF